MHVGGKPVRRLHKVVDAEGDRGGRAGRHRDLLFRDSVLGAAAADHGVGAGPHEQLRLTGRRPVHGLDVAAGERVGGIGYQVGGPLMLARGLVIEEGARILVGLVFGIEGHGGRLAGHGLSTLIHDAHCDAARALRGEVEAARFAHLHAEGDA